MLTATAQVIWKKKVKQNCEGIVVDHLKSLFQAEVFVLPQPLQSITVTEQAACQCIQGGQKEMKERRE